MVELTYSSLGNLLLQLREMKGLSQSEVGKGVGVKSDFISKLERGERNTTPQIISKLSHLYGLDETQLLNIYHTELILQQLDTVEDIKPILELVKKRKTNPSLPFKLPQSLFGDRSSKTITEDRRRYVKGGRFGKVEGLNLYPKKNGKLSRGDRETLFTESEVYISYIRENHFKGVTSDEMIRKGLEYLDPSLSDEENIGLWNTFFERYRERIPRFRTEEEFGDFGSTEEHTTTDEETLSVMEQKADKLLNRIKYFGGGLG